MRGLREDGTFELGAWTGWLAVGGSSFWGDFEGGARVSGGRWCGGFSGVREGEERWGILVFFVGVGERVERGFRCGITWSSCEDSASIYGMRGF